MSYGWLLHPASVATAAIVIRALLALWWGTLETPQLFETEVLVRNWFAGRGFVYPFLGTDYRSYHSLLPYAVVYGVAYGLGGGHPMANLVVQWAFAALLCLLVWRLGMRLGGPPVAGLAAWLAALHPGLLIYDATRLIQFTLDATLVALALLAFVRWAEAPSFARVAGTGLVTGFLMYERGTMAAFFPVALLWVKRVGQPPTRRWIRQVAVYAAVVALVLGPWIVRNAVVHGRLVGLMTTTWMALWEGNNEAATGTEFTTAGQPIKLSYPAELRQRLEGQGELAQNQAFRDAALAFIVTRPARAAELYARKLGFFWWASPHTGILYSRRSTIVYQAWYLVFIGAALRGLVVVAHRGGEPWAIGRLIFWLAVCYSAGQAVFYIGGRHRWTIEPVLGLLSATGFWWSWRMLWARVASNGHDQPAGAVLGRASTMNW